MTQQQQVKQLQTKRAILRRVELFRTLDDIQLDQVCELLKERRCRKGDIIFHQGDPGACLYLIVSGSVRIFLVSPDGREVTIRVYEQGMSFGEFSVLDGKPRSTSAIAQSDVSAFILYRDDFLRLMQNNFALMERVLAMLTERLRYTTSSFENLAFLSVPERIARLLLQLAGDQPQSGSEIRLGLTQQEIATFVNTTREWVNRALNDFAEQGLVRLERGGLVLLDRSGLQQRIQ